MTKATIIDPAWANPSNHLLIEPAPCLPASARVRLRLWCSQWLR